jgi:hypothetical protein
MIRIPLAALAALLIVVPLAGASLKDSPEYKKLPPTANAGMLLGYPTGTYSWHGCTATATATSAFERIPGSPPFTKGSRQRAVTFQVAKTAPYISWQVKAGWTICGVEGAAQLTNPKVDSDLLGEIGYTSGRTKGSTAKDGRETIKVKIPKKGIGHAGFEKFEGKTFGVVQLQDVTVYVKRS